MRHYLYTLLTVAITLSTGCAGQKDTARAKNVILFLADAGGIPVLSAASALGYGEPQKLYVQSWRNIGLSDTSAASEWVTDSAAGMTAIVTGQKTHNGVLSQGADAERGVKDGTPLKTILEYAEERGLSTGVLSSVNIADATPAACYSHVNDRRKFGEIFLQVFSPRFGDGVDIVMGRGRSRIYDGVRALGTDLDQVAAKHGRKIYASLGDVPGSEQRPVVLLEGAMDVPAAARAAIRTLAANPKGYFLMIEWDTHTDDPEEGLTNMIGLDKLVREIAGTADLDQTLLLFTADHSFDFRIHDGKRGDPLLKGWDEWKRDHTEDESIRLPALRVEDDHTGEEVLAAALGPHAEQVNGFFPNTHLFDIMMAAYGWQPQR